MDPGPGSSCCWAFLPSLINQIRTRSSELWPCSAEATAKDCAREAGMGERHILSLQYSKVNAGDYFFSSSLPLTLTSESFAAFTWRGSCRPIGGCLAALRLPRHPGCNNSRSTSSCPPIRLREDRCKNNHAPTERVVGISQDSKCSLPPCNSERECLTEEELDGLKSFHAVVFECKTRLRMQDKKTRKTGVSMEDLTEICQKPESFRKQVERRRRHWRKQLNAQAQAKPFSIEYAKAEDLAR
eukprot:TRINITY_DN27870_c0_g1_i1.p1 TRINITY_DN27870_c0_g1~~TRINITY_DN27870_c0_g1_i1.p1  ORF type:complete len:242 (-),score=30.89 TRINITY_DN27870_c0_g1_i1:304-1029(-)